VKLTVRPIVKAGFERGGENLYLEFTCFEFDREPIELELLENAGCSYSDNALDLDDDHYVDDEPDPEKITHEYLTDYYEIRWAGSLEDLRELVVKLGIRDENEWVWYGSTRESPKKMFRKQHYVDGNAE